MLLAINTTIVMSGVIVFLIVTLILVGMLLFAKAKLTPKGEVKVDINHGEKELVTEPGSTLLATLGNNKIFLRLVEVKVHAVCVVVRLNPEQGLSYRQKRDSSPTNNNTITGAWLVR